MKIFSHDFVTVDMRGLKAPLEAVARRERRSVSDLVRVAVVGRWDLSAPIPAIDHGVSLEDASTARGTVKVSIRLTRDEARMLEARVHRSGLARGVVVAGLLADVAMLKGEARHADHLSALVASNAEMTTLCRYISHLCDLLRKGEGPAAREYRATLETLVVDVRAHLQRVSRELKALKPRQGHHETALERKAT